MTRSKEIRLFYPGCGNNFLGPISSIVESRGGNVQLDIVAHYCDINFNRVSPHVLRVANYAPHHSGKFSSAHNRLMDIFQRSTDNAIEIIGVESRTVYAITPGDPNSLPFTGVYPARPKYALKFEESTIIFNLPKMAGTVHLHYAHTTWQIYLNHLLDLNWTLGSSLDSYLVLIGCGGEGGSNFGDIPQDVLSSFIQDGANLIQERMESITPFRSEEDPFN